MISTQNDLWKFSSMPRPLHLNSRTRALFRYYFTSCLVNGMYERMKTNAFSTSVTRSSGTSGYPRFSLTLTSDVSYSTCFTIGLTTSISRPDESLEGNNPLCAARKALVRAIICTTFLCRYAPIPRCLEPCPFGIA